MAKLYAKRRQVARLSFEDGEVVVTPKDRDIFLISAEKATEACHEIVQREKRIELFESEFLIPLFQWCVERSERIRACYVPFPESHIQVFVVTDAPQFDFELAEEIAALERNLAQKGWRVGVYQLPNTDDETLATFCNPEGALQVYAKPGPTSQEG